ncbi:MAG: 23S rRNA (uracil(1939)-C(5))-methyltransferase RlmD [Desulfovibrionaceae bacterium]|nr:23S rRNA (uracil(1939)-C(5))-methyltransferase RlmD [Desulfovibrionaceae bacterium]
MNEHTLSITALADDGRGVARLDGKVYFVAGALPGQKVRARITLEKKRYAQAECLEILENMPDAQPPLCRHAAQCGGCPLQSMPYTRQLEWKTTMVREAFTRIAHLPQAPILPALPAPATQAYRNKMEFAFGRDAQGGLLLGLRALASRTVFDVRDCQLLPAPAMDIIQAVRKGARATQLPAYDWEAQARAHRAVAVKAEGFWRFAIVRHALDAQGQEGWWLHLITSRANALANAAVRKLGLALLAEFPQLRGVVHDVRNKHDTLAQGEQRLAVLGADGAKLYHNLGGQRFCLDIGSFFQVNTGAAQNLCASTCAAMPPVHEEHKPALWDLYCGVGAPGLLLADQLGQLVGVEFDQNATRMAAHNAAAAGYAHCYYLAGDTATVLATLPQEQKQPDIVLSDPPRSGMSPEVIQAIVKAAPKRIIALSCNPATLARDVALLVAGGYSVQQVQPIDLFPHTMHIENVCLLMRE